MWDLRSQEWDCSVPRMGLSHNPHDLLGRAKREAADKAEKRKQEALRAVAWREVLQDQKARDLMRYVLRLVDGSRAELAPVSDAFHPNAMEMARKAGRLDPIRALWEALGANALAARDLMSQEDHDERSHINPT